MRKKLNTTGKATYTRGVSNVEAQKLFAETLPAIIDSRNDYRAEFMNVSFHLLTNHRSFDINDCLQLVRYHHADKEIPVENIQALWDKWTSKLVAIEKLRKVEGCYQQPVFTTDV